MYVPQEDPRLIVTSVFPIGDQFVTFDRESGEVVDQGHHYSPAIERQAGNIPRSAFLDERFRNVSGAIWSRVAIGTVGSRPLTLVHNPTARVEMPQRWGVWDKEFVAIESDDNWTVSDILDGPAADGD